MLALRLFNSHLAKRDKNREKKQAQSNYGTNCDIVLI